MFGLIGDTFVVGSDIEMARSAAKLEGEPLNDPAASAVRIPARTLAQQSTEDADAADRALDDLLGAITLAASADRSGLKATGRWTSATRPPAAARRAARRR